MKLQNFFASDQPARTDATHRRAKSRRLIQKLLPARPLTQRRHSAITVAEQEFLATPEALHSKSVF